MKPQQIAFCILALAAGLCVAEYCQLGQAMQNTCQQRPLLRLGARQSLTLNGKPLWLDPTKPADEASRDLIARCSLEQKAQLLNHVAQDTVIGTGEELYNCADQWNQCLHGVVWDRPTTMFPISIALAATWDPILRTRKLS